MSKRFVKIQPSDLKIGMFVAELDRPWLETPFLVQGFTVSSASEIKILDDTCNYVIVDTGRSSIKTKSPIQRRSLTNKKSVKSSTKGTSIKETFSNKKLKVYQDKTAFDEELKTAEVIYKSYEETVAKLYDDIQLGQSVDLISAKAVVKKIVDSVVRNPDACVLLQKMRKKGNYVYNHAIGTSIWAAALARQIGLPPKDIQTVTLGGLLCDVGKIRLSNRLLDKPSKLSPEEFELVKSHVEINDQLKEQLKGVSDSVLEIIATHHERHDSSGYPHGVDGHNIPVFSRIVAIADCYDAMTSNKPYAKALSPSDSCKELYQLRDLNFQSEIVEEFIQAVGIYPVGTLVELTNGEVGVIVSEYRKRRLQPALLLLLDSDKNLLDEFRHFDLFKQETEIKISISRSLEPNAYGLDPDDYFQ